MIRTRFWPELESGQMGDHVSRPLSKLFADKTAATLYCHLVLDKLYNCFIVKTCYLNYNFIFSILEKPCLKSFTPRVRDQVSNENRPILTVPSRIKNQSKCPEPKHGAKMLKRFGDSKRLDIGTNQNTRRSILIRRLDDSFDSWK